MMVKLYNLRVCGLLVVVGLLVVDEVAKPFLSFFKSIMENQNRLNANRPIIIISLGPPRRSAISACKKILPKGPQKPSKLRHGLGPPNVLIRSWSGQCLHYSDSKPHLIEVHCNPSTAKRWKLIDGGKRLCDINSAQCIAVSKASGAFFVPNVTLLSMIADDCNNCWLFVRHIALVNNQIIFDMYGAHKINAAARLQCVTTTKTPDPFLLTTVTVQLCNNNYKNQNWSFVSVE